jgi:hypothetical protein
MHLEAVSRLYPKAWKQADMFRAARGEGEIPNWPDWCFLPMGGWYEISSGDVSQEATNLQSALDTGRLAALGTWRVTQGIYRFDPSIYAAVIATPLDGNIPSEVLFRLPEWCVYIETPGMQFMGETLFGFFAHLEWFSESQQHELCLVLDLDGNESQLIPLSLPLLEPSGRTLMQAIAQTEYVEGCQSALSSSTSSAGENLQTAAALQPIISLLLYLCSVNSEIGDGSRKPGFPIPRKTKQGMRMFPADKPTTWDVGVRMGSALRRAYHQQETTPSVPQNSPRPHIRRAHWHGFWQGSINTPAKRKLALKWLPPIPVNLADPDQLVPVIRPIGGNND